MKSPTKTDILRGRIKGWMVTYGKTSEEIAVKMHMSRRTWDRRLHNPETLTVEELIKLEKLPA